MSLPLHTCILRDGHCAQSRWWLTRAAVSKTHNLRFLAVGILVPYIGVHWQLKKAAGWRLVALKVMMFITCHELMSNLSIETQNLTWFYSIFLWSSSTKIVMFICICSQNVTTWFLSDLKSLINQIRMYTRLLYPPIWTMLRRTWIMTCTVTVTRGNEIQNCLRQSLKHALHCGLLFSALIYKPRRMCCILAILSILYICIQKYKYVIKIAQSSALSCFKATLVNQVAMKKTLTVAALKNIEAATNTVIRAMSLLQDPHHSALDLKATVLVWNLENFCKYEHLEVMQ